VAVFLPFTSDCVEVTGDIKTSSGDLGEATGDDTKKQ